jgi:hypothetical protein
MYSYPFKNSSLLREAINGIGPAGLVRLLLEGPLDFPGRQTTSAKDIDLVKAQSTQALAPLFGPGISNEALNQSLSLAGREAEGLTGDPAGVRRCFTWIRYNLIRLDCLGDDSAQDVESGKVDWRKAHAALTAFQSANPSFLAHQLVMGLCRRHGVRGKFHEMISMSIGRVALKGFRRDLTWGKTVDEEAISHIVDWLISSYHNNAPWLKNADSLGRPKKLLKFGTIDAMALEADRQMMRMVTDRKSDALGPLDIETFVDKGGDYYLARLKTVTALDHESALMRHCVGHGAYDHRLDDKCYFLLSLRNRAGRPHMTLEIDGGIVRQAFGKANSNPKDKYTDEARRLLADVVFERPNDEYRQRFIADLGDQRAA